MPNIVEVKKEDIEKICPFLITSVSYQTDSGEVVQAQEYSKCRKSQCFYFKDGECRKVELSLRQ